MHSPAESVAWSSQRAPRCSVTADMTGDAGGVAGRTATSRPGGCRHAWRASGPRAAATTSRKWLRTDLADDRLLCGTSPWLRPESAWARWRASPAAAHACGGAARGEAHAGLLSFSMKSRGSGGCDPAAPQWPSAAVRVSCCAGRTAWPVMGQACMHRGAAPFPGEDGRADTELERLRIQMDCGHGATLRTRMTLRRGDGRYISGGVSCS